MLAARENGRAFLATKVGDLVVQLEKGDQARCARLAFQVDPDTEFDDIRRGWKPRACAARRATMPRPASRRCWRSKIPRAR